MPWAGRVTVEERRTTLARWEREWDTGGDLVYGLFLGPLVAGGFGLHRRIGPTGLEIGYWVHRRTPAGATPPRPPRRSPRRPSPFPASRWWRSTTTGPTSPARACPASSASPLSRSTRGRRPRPPNPAPSGSGGCPGTAGGRRRHRHHPTRPDHRRRASAPGIQRGDGPAVSRHLAATLTLLTIVSLPGAQSGEMTSPVGTFG